jgi:hypothetical protein
MPVPETDQNDDNNNNDDGGDDIASWMAQRQQDVASRDQNAAAGRDAWAASTATGQNLQAATPDDVRALGADVQGQDAAVVPPIKRGDKASLSDDTRARILMNEFRSYSGPGAMQAIINGAHALINADEAFGPKRPKTAKPAQAIPAAEAAIFQRMQEGLATAKAQRAQGIDPTNGATHFSFPTTDTRELWLGKYPIRTQVGPLHNSFTYGDVPSSTAWANTYQE